MPEFSKVHGVKHRAEDMFALVADVERYPEFVPLCKSLSVRNRKMKDDNEILLADMTVSYLAISETFASQVLLKPQENIIDVKYIDGPFKYLYNQWKFEPTGDTSCNVHFSIDYEFKSKTLGLLMGSMFDMAFRKFTSAFETRADEIYDSQGNPGS